MAKLLPIRGPAPPPVAKRPRCAACKKPLRPNMSQPYERVTLDVPDVELSAFTARVVGTKTQTFMRAVGVREWDGTYGDGHGFCGLNCEATYGRMALQVLARVPKHCGTCGARIILKEK